MTSNAPQPADLGPTRTLHETATHHRIAAPGGFGQQRQLYHQRTAKDHQKAKADYIGKAKGDLDMNTIWAKFLYCQSVGWDMSEMPIAAEREQERQALYRKRTGSAHDYKPGGEIGLFIILGNPMVWIGAIIAGIMIPKIIEAWI